MNSFLNKVFRLSDIRYFWLLLASMLFFVFALLNNRLKPDISTTEEWITYGGALACAFVWAVLNYVGQIKINALYRKRNSIGAYVDSLAMKKEEKADLLTYLHDYVKDLEANGKSEEEAVKTAIGQFQIREFLEVSRYSGLFELPAHYYLLGYAIVFLAAIIVIQCLLGAVFPDMFLLQAFKFMLILYAAAFVLLPILYKVADVLVRKKMIS